MQQFGQERLRLGVGDSDQEPARGLRIVEQVDGGFVDVRGNLHTSAKVFPIGATATRNIASDKRARAVE